MSGTHYSAQDRHRIAAEAERLRDGGFTLAEAAGELGVPSSTLSAWVRPRPHRASYKPPARVGWDALAACWRIYVYDPMDAKESVVQVNWWPLRWLRFATREAAEEHLERRGEYRPEAVA